MSTEPAHVSTAGLPATAAEQELTGAKRELEAARQVLEAARQQYISAKKGEEPDEEVLEFFKEDYRAAQAEVSSLVAHVATLRSRVDALSKLWG
jgi:uncharacterized protein (DUF3084 family)